MLTVTISKDFLGGGGRKGADLTGDDNEKQPSLTRTESSVSNSNSVICWFNVCLSFRHMCILFFGYVV